MSEQQIDSGAAQVQLFPEGEMSVLRMQIGYVARQLHTWCEERSVQLTHGSTPGEFESPGLRRAPIPIRDMLADTMRDLAFITLQLTDRIEVLERLALPADRNVYSYDLLSIAQVIRYFGDSSVELQRDAGQEPIKG